MAKNSIHIFVIVVIATFLMMRCDCLNNGLGKTPQMGWNSWNKFACDINEGLIREVIDAMVKTGLRDLGYTYVNLDDCWQSSRDANGVIVPDPKNFPNGIKPLVDYAHSKGFKFGLYSDAGLQTCQKRPGSLGYEKIDANQYAKWEIDYLKYDNCFNNHTKPELRYPPMRDALNATGRPIFFSMCEWGQDQPATWAKTVGNSWRTFEDIKDFNLYMYYIIKKNDKWWQYAGPGGWNDPDMLEVGNGKLNHEEYKTHMALWCLAKAPLILGCDVRNMDANTVEIVTNKEAIAINQDSLGIQGHRVKSSLLADVWAGPIAPAGKAWTAVLVNKDPILSATVTFNFADIGIPSGAKLIVRDLWLHKDVGTYTASYSAVLKPFTSTFITARMA